MQSWPLGKGHHSCGALLLLLAQTPGTDGRAGITCRNAPDRQRDWRGEGIADIAEMPRLMGSSLPGAAEATNSPHPVPQTETGWMGCMLLSSVPVQFVTPYSDRHSLGALPGHGSDVVGISTAQENILIKIT
uniref:Uncharacterized protein n=1 Tax=Myotis myotis TaxID=51298 RepID=A0A7J7UQ68_MYOMY|nr:hypothetical protein mMyoMyo1_008671 [Myotis myotis]